MNPFKLATYGVEITEKRKTFTAMLMIPLIIITCAWACNVQSVVTQVNNILVEVGPAIQIVVSLLPLLTGKNIPANVVSSINSWATQAQQDVTQLGAIVQQYQGDLTNPTTQAKINAVIQTTENDITSVLTMIHVLDPATQNKITEIVTATAAAIVSVENIIANYTGAKVKRTLAKGQFVANGADFKNKFNALLHAPTGDASVDAATAKLKI